ncbi:MAG TPA: hypothetical protein VE360_10030 [Pyrinomonadaceae bacterium]|nr:hypothetical protein [Pyrinomonadaceae bacterium]
MNLQSVPPQTLERLLDELDVLKRPDGDRRARARLRGLLAMAARRDFEAARPLVRFHEILLFLRAYPQSAGLLRQAERLLASFGRRVEKLYAGEAADLVAFEEAEASGIAGTSFSAVFSYDIARWLAARHPSRVRIEWGGNEDAAQLAATLPLLVPLLDENAYVDIYFSREDWLRAARGRTREITWLARAFARWELPERAKAVVYDSLKLALRWQLGDSGATRTRMKRPVREVFYHDAPLVSRRDVSLARELSDAAPLPVEKLSPAEGRRLLDAGRETMSVRYRELYGFTHGDPRGVRRAEVGRGVEIFLWGVPAARRYPTIAYHAMLIFKNGVPCGYAEGLTLFERTEVGLNLFYTFREGESAWVYARLLRLMRQLLGARVFSVEPYQLGFHNDEGIQSGAFWFYRKLGFRPVLPRLARLVEREERKLAERPGYRSPAPVLRQLATGHMLYEAPASSTDRHAHSSSKEARASSTVEQATTSSPGEWDNFHLRRLGLAVQRRIAAHHDGDPERAHRAAVKRVERALGAGTARWNEAERRALRDLSLVLALIPDLSRWTPDEKRALLQIVRAKAGSDETRYLRLLQQHTRLRREIIRMGSER